VLPSSVNVCGIRWDVVIVDDPADVDAFRRAPLWGQMVPARREIRIQGGRPPEELLATLLHEIVHIVRDEVLAVGTETREDEQEVTALSAVLADTLIRNNLARLPSR
jgi:hypothetical protein